MGAKTARIHAIPSASMLVLLVFGAARSSAAESITVPLPQLIGPYTVGSREFSFDLGTAFEAIDAVEVQLKGRGFPGLGVGDGVERPVEPPFAWPAHFSVVIDPDPGFGLWVASTGTLNGPFEFRQPFEPFLTRPSWDFLLSGHGSIIVGLVPLFIIGGLMVGSQVGDP
jgi:hypothetical protein